MATFDCASKAALVALTLRPGYAATEMSAAWFASELGKKQVQGLPRRRPLDSEALEEGLLLLCGAAAAHMTAIDDGQSLS